MWSELENMVVARVAMVLRIQCTDTLHLGNCLNRSEMKYGSSLMDIDWKLYCVYFTFLFLKNNIILKNANQHRLVWFSLFSSVKLGLVGNVPPPSPMICARGCSYIQQWNYCLIQVHTSTNWKHFTIWEFAQICAIYPIETTSWRNPPGRNRNKFPGRMMERRSLRSLGCCTPMRSFTNNLYSASSCRDNSEMISSPAVRWRMSLRILEIPRTTFTIFMDNGGSKRPGKLWADRRGHGSFAYRWDPEGTLAKSCTSWRLRVMHHPFQRICTSWSRKLSPPESIWNATERWDT